MSSKLVSVSLGEHGSTGSCGASNGARFFLIEIVGVMIGACHCKPLLDLTAPLFAERIVKMNDGLFLRNSFALDPSYRKLREPLYSGCKEECRYIDIGDGSSVLNLRFFELCSKNFTGDQVIE